MAEPFQDFHSRHQNGTPFLANLPQKRFEEEGDQGQVERLDVDPAPDDADASVPIQIEEIDVNEDLGGKKLLR